jgi:predicted DNA-binding protein with PD1-like motif
MKYSEATLGRVFVLRLEDGEIVHEEIETFAQEHGIQSAAVLVLGGADEGSRLVVGPEQARATPVVKMEHQLDGVHEMAGVGTIFPDDEDRPMLHLHLSCGRRDQATVGCARDGVKTWHVGEVVIIELLGSPARRLFDPVTGFKLLQPRPSESGGTV